MKYIALIGLALILCKPAIAENYDRKLYGNTWGDADKDCQDTRQEVLIQESLTPVILDTKGCKVISGKWYDPYTAKVFEDPRDLDIDHFIPLKEAHVSGAALWPKDRKESYANFTDDPDHLIAVYKSANRSKGAKDPVQWMPDNASFHCQYLARWVSLKAKWNLSMDKVEREQVMNRLKACF